MQSRSVIAPSKDTFFIVETILANLTPTELLTINKWAEKYISMPSNTSKPGRVTYDDTPYQIEILEALSPQSPARDIILVQAAQTGKTFTFLLAMLYNIIADPCPQAFMFPNDRDAKRFIKEKLNPLIDQNKFIKDALGLGKRGSGDTLDGKDYAGGFLRFVFATSPSTLRSYSIKRGYADEIDPYKDTQDEGNPIDLYRKRTNTFSSNRKFCLSSTPKNNNSKILEEIATSTYQKFFVPCPHCKELMTFEFQYFHIETNEEGTIVKDCYMECPHCHKAIKEGAKTYMYNLKNGAKWIATNPDAPPERVGFFLNGFYSALNWLSWYDIASEYTRALASSETERLLKLISFYNTVLCEQYRSDFGLTPSPVILMREAQKSPYKRGIVPSWVMAITTGTDVQKDRIETTVIGWGKNGRNYTIDHLIFFKHEHEHITDERSIVWYDYQENVLNGKWEREDGFVLDSMANGIDRSYEADGMDKIVLSLADPRVYLMRGVDKKTDTAMPSLKHSSLNKRAVYYDTPVSIIKGMLYSYLTLKENSDNSQSNMCYFPRDFDFEFYEQLCSEHMEFEKDKMKWIKDRDRNETLDTRVYAYAAYFICGLFEFSENDWEEVRLIQDELKQSQNSLEVQKQARGQRVRRVVNSGIKI